DPRKTVEFSCNIKNQSPEPIDLTAPKVSCSCVTAELEKGHLLPNEATKVNMTIDPGKIKGNEFSFSVFFGCQQAKKELSRFRITGTVHPEFTYSPKAISFREVPPGARHLGTIEVRQNSDIEVKLVKVDVAGKGLRLETRETTKKTKPKAPRRRAWQIEVWLEDDVAPGKIKGNVVLKTNITRHRNIIIPVSGVVADAGKEGR
ncbi:DUF1573 domain-containing protein, partial [Candidatus Hydrogenedentota bacterium]